MLSRQPTLDFELIFKTDRHKYQEHKFASIIHSKSQT